MNRVSSLFVIISVLSACVLWFTRSEWMPSLSSFALSDNALWYRMMHLTASWFLIINVRSSIHNLFLGIGMGLILIFDMYYFPMVHNIVTASTLFFACFSIIYNAKGFDRSAAIFLSIIAIGIFIVGYTVQSFHFLLAEIIALASVMIGKLRELWK